MTTNQACHWPSYCPKGIFFLTISSFSHVLTRKHFYKRTAELAKTFHRLVIFYLSQSDKIQLSRDLARSWETHRQRLVKIPFSYNGIRNLLIQLWQYVFSQKSSWNVIFSIRFRGWVLIWEEGASRDSATQERMKKNTKLTNLWAATLSLFP